MSTIETTPREQKPVILDIGTHLIPHESPNTEVRFMSNAEFAAEVLFPDGTTGVLEAFHESTLTDDGQRADGFDFRGRRVLSGEQSRINYFVSALHDQRAPETPPEPAAYITPTLPGLEFPEPEPQPAAPFEHPAPIAAYARYVMEVALGIRPPMEGDYWNEDETAEVTNPSEGDRFGDF